MWNKPALYYCFLQSSVFRGTLSCTASVVCRPWIIPGASRSCLLSDTMMRAPAMQELSQFVAEQWVALPDAATGGQYYYNQVTGRTQWDEPITPHKARPGLSALLHSPLLTALRRCNPSGEARMASFAPLPPSSILYPWDKAVARGCALCKGACHVQSMCTCRDLRDA